MVSLFMMCCLSDWVGSARTLSGERCAGLKVVWVAGDVTGELPRLVREPATVRVVAEVRSRALRLSAVLPMLPGSLRLLLEWCGHESALLELCHGAPPFGCGFMVAVKRDSNPHPALYSPRSYPRGD